MEYHLPVMLDECIEGLNIRPDGIYVDVTFGGGGHSRAILARLGAGGHLLAFDQDADAEAESAKLAVGNNGARFTFIHENFRYMKSFLRLQGVRRVDGILADLGVSSHQLDAGERGFSTRTEGELDLRMDRRQELTARVLVNTATEGELTQLLRLYGELPNARQMARAIVRRREEGEIETTFDLREAVAHNLPRGKENKYLAMLFQALRIEVNGELEALKALLRQSAEVLAPGGRLVVMSYHSLEDRLVKNYMKTGNFDGEVEKDFYGNLIAPLAPVVRKAMTAGEAELLRNPRARSAKLRVAEKKNEPA